MYKVISNKTGIVLRTELVKTLNLDWDFKDFDDAYKFYEEHVKEHANHIATLRATSINHDIQLVEITEEGTKLHYRLHLSN